MNVNISTWNQMRHGMDDAGHAARQVPCDLTFCKVAGFPMPAHALQAWGDNPATILHTQNRHLLPTHNSSLQLEGCWSDSETVGLRHTHYVLLHAVLLAPHMLQTLESPQNLLRKGVVLVHNERCNSHREHIKLLFIPFEG